LKSLGFVIKCARRYAGPLGITVASMLLLVGVQLLAPWLIRSMVATVTDPAAGPEAFDMVSRLALVALLVYAARAVLSFFRSYMAHVAGWHVVADVRRDIYNHLQRLSLRFYEDKQTGQLMSRMVNDSELLEQLIAHAIPDVLVNVLMLVGVMAVLVGMSWQLALLSLIPIPLIVLAMRGVSPATCGRPFASGRWSWAS
jgi:ATP-binding cassette, subfamily B, bacterial